MKVTQGKFRLCMPNVFEPSCLFVVVLGKENTLFNGL